MNHSNPLTRIAIGSENAEMASFDGVPIDVVSSDTVKSEHDETNGVAGSSSGGFWFKWLRKSI